MTLRIAVEPTNHCNLNCNMCYSKIRKKGYMNIDLFMKIVDEAKLIGIGNIDLLFGGESMLHPNFVDMINYISDKGIPMRMSTNGTLITEEIAVAIGKSTLKVLNVSIHDGVDLDKLKSNIELLFKYNENNVDIFGTYTKSEHDEEARSKIDSEIVPMFEVRVDKPNRNEECRWEKAQVKGNVYCTKMRRYMPILWDGRVTTCCYDWEGKNAFGNVGKDGLASTWGSEHYIKLRKDIVNNIFHYDLCRTCNLWK